MLDKYVRVMQDKYEDSEITSEIGSESLLKKYMHISMFTRSKYKLEIIIKITMRWYTISIDASSLYLSFIIVVLLVCKLNAS